MPKTVTTLTGVRTKSGASAKGPWLLSIFTTADGREFCTFKGDLASKANALLNTPVEVEYSPGNDPVKYPNSFNLDGLEVVSGAPQAQPDAAAEATQPDAAAEATQPLVFSPTINNKNDQFRTKEQIMRTDALNAALTMFGIIGLDPLSGVEEFHGWFESLYKLIEAGVFETPDVRVEA